MPRRRSSILMNKLSKKRHLRNFKIKKELKKKIKELQMLVASKNTQEAQKALKEVFSKLDKAAKKKIIHPATADRRKSRLNKKVMKTA
ncbi:MAG: 30S ribosomal protein S20 [Candidatus Omnitrophota bacterium]|jgi:small subunit ribosomal protein S20|nr:30S ribosomal protein S20 [Candidatus Omnitrophota bacterium]MDD3982493.1 30S ribosomal protein S20 [Candidatus Omnitrophota bacterium]